MASFRFPLDDTLHRVSSLFGAGCPPALRRRFGALSTHGPVQPLDGDEVQGQPLWRAIVDSQHHDGSVGDKAAVSGRILSTLWTLRTLTDLGGGPSTAAWKRAVAFLLQHAVVDGGFSFTGERGGVLSCYTGLCAWVLHQGQDQDGGAEDPAVEGLRQTLMAWLESHQQVQRRGDSLRVSPPTVFSAHLATRYGGCFSGTSCLTGVVRAAQALPASSDVAQAARAFLLRRELFLTSEGRVLPLMSTRDASDEKRAQWLKVHHPIAYHVDLVETLQVVTKVGPWDVRMQRAVDHLMAKQLDDGSWPLEAKGRQPGLLSLERLNQRRGSPMATLRVLEALAPLA